MSKWVKRLLGVAAVATTAAGIFYFLKKNDTDMEETFEDDFEDDDFNLDKDLQPASGRGYVSLHSQSKSTDSAEADETAEADQNAEPDAAEETDNTEEIESANEEAATEEVTDSIN